MIALAVNVEDVAWPLAPVVCVHVVAVFDAHAPKVALAPEAGTVNVTETPGTPLAQLSTNAATSLFVNAVLTVADWLPPEVAVIEVIAPALTVKLGDVPEIEPDVTFNVVLWASKRVIDDVAVPLVKVTEPG